MTKHEIFRLTTSDTSTVNAIFNTSGTGQAVKGWIEKVAVKSTSWANGSLFLTDVATGENILTLTAASGANTIVKYPRRFIDHDSVASSAAGLSGTAANFKERHYVNGPIVCSGLGLGSAAAGTTGTVEVYYYD